MGRHGHIGRPPGSAISRHRLPLRSPPLHHQSPIPLPAPIANTRPSLAPVHRTACPALPPRCSAPMSAHAPPPAPECVGDYTLATEIGKGSFAVVRKGYRTRPPRQAVAVKVISRAVLTDKLVANLDAEINILQSLAHPSVVELLDCIKNADHIFLVMPFCPWGDLSMYIKSHGQLPSSPLREHPTTDPVFNKEDLGASVIANNALMASAPDEQTAIEAVWSDVKNFPHPAGGGLNSYIVRSFLYQLSSALEFMWRKHIVHRDIKPQNLLLQPAEPAFLAAGQPLGIPQIKVADFGFARHLPAASLAETLCGSPLYMAPEILRHEKYDAKADLWSVGAVTYEMVTGKPPFKAANYMELLRRIEKNDDRIRFPDERSEGSWARENIRRAEDGLPPIERPPEVASDLKAIIRALLKRHSITRTGFDELFQAPVVASGSARQLAVALGRPLPQTSSQMPAPAPIEETPEEGLSSNSPYAVPATTPPFSTPVPASAPAPTPAPTPAPVLSTAAPSTAATIAPPVAPASASVPASAVGSARRSSAASMARTPSTEALPAYPPRRSNNEAPRAVTAVPIPGAVPNRNRLKRLSMGHEACSVPTREDTLPSRLQPTGSPGVLNTPPAFIKTSMAPSSLPDAGGLSSTRPQFLPARRTTIGFQTTTRSTLSKPPVTSQAPSPAPQTAERRASCLAQHRAKLETPAAPSPPAPVAGSSLAAARESDISSSSTSPSVTPPAQDSPGRQSSRDAGSLLDGEYAMVEARAPGSEVELENKPLVAFPGSYPSSAHAAASAAASVAAAAFGRAPIRGLRQMRAPSFSRFTSARQSSSPAASPTTFAQPALLPDRPRKESKVLPKAGPSALTSAKPPSPEVASLPRHIPASRPVDPPSGSSGSSLPNSRSMMGGGSSSGTGATATPTMAATGGIQPTPSTPSSTSSQVRPLPIPKPAFALPAHQRPASFHRRSSASFSSSGHSFSPRLHQPITPGGGGFSPVPPSGVNPVQPIPCTGRSAPAGPAGYPPFAGLARTPPGSGPDATGALGGIGTSPGTTEGHLIRGPSISPSPSSYLPPPGELGSSLTRAMSQASIRLFGIPSVVALRNAQAIMRGRTWRSQSYSGAAGMTHSLLGGAAPGESAMSLAGEPDQAERNMLGLMLDYYHKAHVLSELAGSMFTDQFGAPPPARVDSNAESDWRDPAVPPGPSRSALGAVIPAVGRSSSSLSLASASVVANEHAVSNEPGTPGTTPSSTPFSSAALMGTSASPSKAAADSEAIAAECLLIYLRAAALIDRGLQTTREFLDARQANGWTRAPCTDLTDRMSLLGNIVREN